MVELIIINETKFYTNGLKHLFSIEKINEADRKSKSNQEEMFKELFNDDVLKHWTLTYYFSIPYPIFAQLTLFDKYQLLTISAATDTIFLKGLITSSLSTFKDLITWGIHQTKPMSEFCKLIRNSHNYFSNNPLLRLHK